jgi:hypothetical protein
MYNNFSGTVPSQWAALTALQQLALDGQPQLTGQFPVGFTAFQRLTRLTLTRTGLTGTIRLQFPLLRVLGLFGSRRITIQWSDIPALTALIVLSANGCVFSGTIPSDISALKALTYLDVSEGSVNGTIPDTLRQLTRLT